MTKIFLATFLSIFLGSVVSMQHTIECNNFVPDEETAIRVAEAIWLPIYGDGVLKKTPFNAELVDDKIWRVTGTLQAQKGGVPKIEIQKCDCKILLVSHSK